jgi:hypothetical protein
MLNLFKKVLDGSWLYSYRQTLNLEEPVTSIAGGETRTCKALSPTDATNRLHKAGSYSKLLSFIQPFGLNNIPVIQTDQVRCGGTGYMDLMEVGLFDSCPTDAKIIRGQDEYGRYFVSMYLRVEKYSSVETAETNSKGDKGTKKSPSPYTSDGSGVQSFKAVYTVFQRYSDDPEKICICNSHMAKDVHHVLIGSLLGMGCLDLEGNVDAYSRFENMLYSLLKHRVWQKAVPTWENCSETEIDSVLNGTVPDKAQKERHQTVYRVFFA